MCSAVTRLAGCVENGFSSLPFYKDSSVQTGKMLFPPGADGHILSSSCFRFDYISSSLRDQRTLLLLLLSHLQQTEFRPRMSLWRTTHLPLILLSLRTAAAVQPELKRRTSVCRQEKISTSCSPGVRGAGEPRRGPSGTHKGGNTPHLVKITSLLQLLSYFYQK